jgi:mannitol 2-dehydrogenase
MRVRPVSDVPLCAATLSTVLQRGVAVPGYDRSQLRPRIVHIGVGGFHRAHLAMLCDALATRGASDWGIRGVGLLPGDAAMFDALSAQDCFYTLTRKSASVCETAVIGSIIDYRFAADDPTVAVDAIADPQTAIVSMTVTEAGYADNAPNRRTFDVIAAGLDRRRREATGPVSVLSCDNLPGNGHSARACTVAAARRVSDDCARWVDEHCSFPNSMVDRITPATSDADRRHLVDTFGIVDRWPVVAEVFWQWALEDRFVAGRPAFDEVGVQFTDDVESWELYKLRLLNAGHSAIAYVSALAGITFVDEAVGVPEIRSFLTSLLLDEAVPTLAPIPGSPREDYVATVLERFANTAVRDQIARLCIDGTSKFPTFLIPTVSAQLAGDRRVEMSALALAGWAHYLADVADSDQSHDDHGAASRSLARAAVDDPAAFLRASDVFPDAVAADDAFVDAYVRAHRLIGDVGPIRAVAAVLESVR